MDITRQYIKQFLNEAEEFLDQKLPTRTTRTSWGQPILTRNAYPMTFRILDFLDANGYNDQNVMKAFAKHQKGFNTYYNYDYNRKSKTIDPGNQYINFEWIEEYPEKAIERLWQKNQNIFQKDYSSFEEFKSALMDKKGITSNLYVIEFKKEVPVEKIFDWKDFDELSDQWHSPEADMLIKPYKEKVLSVLRDLQSKYSFPITDSTFDFSFSILTGSAGYSIVPKCRFRAVLKKHKREKQYYQAAFKDIENTLKQKLPEFEVSVA